MTTPKPPRDDDVTPPAGPKPRRATEPRGHPIIERQPTQRDPERDRRTPKHGTAVARPESWDNDFTPPNIGDPETYRAVRELRKQTAQQDVQIAVIANEVSGIKAQVGAVDAKLDKVNDSLIRVATIVEEERDQITVTETKMIASQTATTTAKETLADQVLRIDAAAQRFKHKMWLKIAGGVFSGGVLVALIAFIGERC